ncbi:hypothetical protein FQN49_001878 [Arthroderma sp. PD_2]|nr:hypothetical protein FQN49_001878 [Arthroderma sp. PD_2]
MSVPLLPVREKHSIQSTLIKDTIMNTETQANEVCQEPKMDTVRTRVNPDHHHDGPSSAAPTEPSPQLNQEEDTHWHPTLKTRQYSFNAQENKHNLQSRLTGLVKGKETGFTERDGR